MPEQSSVGGLPPLVYSATMAVFLAALNLSKWIPYAWLGLLDGRNLLSSLALAPLAPKAKRKQRQRVALKVAEMRIRRRRAPWRPNRL